MEVRPKWTEEELDIIFSKATLVQDGLRKDASGEYIHRDAYGKAEHPWGWEVDHIKPISEGGTNKLNNVTILFSATPILSAVFQPIK